MSGAFAKINWHGTDVSLRFICPCSAVSHFEGFEAAVLKCVSCGKHWEMPTSINVSPAEQPAQARPMSMTLSTA